MINLYVIYQQTHQMTEDTCICDFKMVPLRKHNPISNGLYLYHRLSGFNLYRYHSSRSWNMYDLNVNARDTSLLMYIHTSILLQWINNDQFKYLPLNSCFRYLAESLNDILVIMGRISIARALSVRLLFASHGVVSIWRLTDVTNDARYWYLAGTLILLAIESLIAIFKRQGKEWKWWVNLSYSFSMSR